METKKKKKKKDTPSLYFLSLHPLSQSVIPRVTRHLPLNKLDNALGGDSFAQTTSALCNNLIWRLCGDDFSLMKDHRIQSDTASTDGTTVHHASIFNSLFMLTSLHELTLSMQQIGHEIGHIKLIQDTEAPRS